MASDSKFWKQYSRAYDDVIGNYSGHKKLVEEHLRALEGFDSVLESGCGPGHLTKELLDREHFVVAMDINPDALNLLKKRCGNTSKLKVKLGDVNKLPYPDNYFDAVSSMLVLWAMRDPKKYLLEHNRVLKKRGRLVLSGPWPETRESVDLQLRKIKEDLESQGLFPRMQKSWDSFLKYTDKNVSNTTEHWFSNEEIKKLLKETGFEIKSIKSNPVYCNQGHIVIATKN